MSVIKCSLFIFIACLFFASCKQEVNLPDQPLEDYINVYMPQAANGAITYNFSTADTFPQTIIYGAAYGGQDYPEQDVAITFEINDALIDSFNTANNTAYVLLPQNSYNIESTEGFIKKGELSTQPFKVTVFVKGENAPDMSKTYLLPISIKSSSVKVNEKLRTHFCIINIIPTFFDRKNWIITGFSSQEATGEGENNGRAVFVLDDDIKTFWHSQWQGAQPGPPHYITFDLNETKTISGAAIVARQGVDNGRPQDIEILVSADNANWETIYEGTLQNINDQQKVFFNKTVESRYVRLQINSSYGSNLTHLAEFYLF